MKITLKPEQEKFIKAQLDSGKFANLEQVIEVAFHLLEKFSDEYKDWIETTRDKIEVGIAELDEGKGNDGETVVGEILARFKQAHKDEK